MKPPALRILRSDVSFDRLRFCGSAADHRHARCAGRHDDNRRQLSSASAPAVRRHDQHGWAGTAGDRFNGGQSAGMQAVVQPAIRLQCTSKVSFGSKCEILIWSRCFPLYTRKRTQVRHRAMSEKCRYCCKRSKVASVRIFGETLKREAIQGVRFRLLG